VHTEKFLTKRAEELNKEELVEVYELFSPRLFRYAMRLLGDHQHAEECVSETFSRFLTAIKNGGGPRDNLQAYLYRAAHNWITDFYRKRPPEELVESILLRDPQQNPVMVVAKDQERERVRIALLRLTDEQRQVILLRFYEDWPYEEIAAALGKSYEATRALHHRALVGLRKMLIGSEE
jgi:RNA polymerase sigma-70 factor, ECF subfamily